VLQRGFGFVRLGFEQILIEHHRQVAFRPQKCGCPGQTFRHGNALARSLMQRRSALGCSLARRYKKDHDAESFRNSRANCFHLKINELRTGPSA